MRPQLKLVLLVAVVLVATLSAVVWKTQGLLLEDKLRFINDSSLKQIAPLKRLVTEKIESGKRELVQFATARESQGPGHTNAFGSFDVVALLEPTPPSQNTQWSPTWIEKGPNARQDRWPSGYDVTLLKSLPYARVKDGQALWVRLSDSQGSPLYAILVSVEMQATSLPAGNSTGVPAPSPATGGALPDTPTTSVTGIPSSPSAPTVAPSGPRRAVVVGFTSENPLAPITDDYIGSISTVFILDDRGYVASHVDKAYLGSLFSEDSIAKEVMKGQKVSDTGEYEDLDGKKVLGHFERIENTNLTAVITTPVSAATSIAEESVRNTILVGGSVGFLGLILAWLVGSSLAGPVMIQPLRDRAEKMTDLGDVSVAPAPTLARVEEPQTKLDVSSERLKEERKFAFEALNSSLAARLREPLLAVIGHAQLVKTKTNDEDVLAHVDSIEREARLAKDSIEHWQILEEAPSLLDSNEKLDLEKVVLAALADKSLEIEGSGIELVKNLSSVPSVMGSARDVETALENMIENSVEAMRDQHTRRLTVKLTTVGQSVRLTLEDTGIGMTRDVKDKAFEPFFKGFEAPRHMGLGLAFVQNTLKKSGATCEIESTPGEGARFVLKFPVDTEAKRSYDASKAAPVIKVPPVVAPEPSFQLGGKPPLAEDESLTLPPFPGKPLSQPLTQPAKQAVAQPSAPSPAFDVSGDDDDEDEDDKFASVSFNAPESHRDLTTESSSSDSDSNSDSNSDSDMEHAGTEWQVKIRRPKPKGQS